MGDSRNLPLLFLHGFLGSGRDWFGVAESLAREYFCVLVDLPGHGKTRLRWQPGDDPFRFGGRKLLAVLDTLQIDQSVLLGYSMGGRMALATLLSYPDRFSALILESAHPGLEDEAERKTRSQWEEEICERLGREEFPIFLNRWYAMAIFRSLQKNPPQLAAIIERRMQNRPEWPAAVFSGFGLSRQPNFWPQLVKITVPVLLIAGDLDPKYCAITSRMHRLIPQSHLVIIQNAGHMVHEEKEKTFTLEVKKFLRSLVNSRFRPSYE